MVTEIMGRYVLGEPAGSFYQTPHPAKQFWSTTHRADATVDIAEVGELRVLAGALRGTGHYGSGMVRQDSVAYLKVGDEDDEDAWVIAAVADGVSASALSSELADFAVRQGVLLAARALKESRHNLDAMDWHAVSTQVGECSMRFCSARAKAKGITVTEGMDVRGLWACTLELAVVQASPCFGQRQACVASICGDGSAYIMNATTGWQCLKRGKTPSADGVVSNAVDDALPQPPANPHVVRFALQEGDNLLVVTDGLGDVLGDPSEEDAGWRSRGLADFYQRELPLCDSAGSFLRLLETCIFQASDDRSAVFIHPLYPPTETAPREDIYAEEGGGYDAGCGRR